MNDDGSNPLIYQCEKRYDDNSWFVERNVRRDYAYSSASKCFSFIRIYQQSLADKLDEKFPRRSAEDWLSKSCKIADDQTNSIKEISEAIENLGADGTDTIVEIFSDRVGTQMDRFSVALDKFTNNIAEILANAQKISDEINKNLLGTLEKLNESLKQDRIKQE